MLELVTSYGDTTGISVVNQVLRQFNSSRSCNTSISSTTARRFHSCLRPSNIVPGRLGQYDPPDRDHSAGRWFFRNGIRLFRRRRRPRPRHDCWAETPKAAYEYFGLGGIAAVNYLSSDTPIIASTLATGSSYPCFDQFGRLIEVHGRKQRRLEPRRSEYGYNRASDRTFRKDVVAGG